MVVTSSVCPSGGAFATWLVPMVLPPPGRLLTMTGTGQLSVRRWEISRATVSVVPPATNGTTSSICRLGYVSAAHGQAPAHDKRSSARKARVEVLGISFLWPSFLGIASSLVFRLLLRQGGPVGIVVTPSLPSVPVIDVREGGPVQHAREGRIRARGLRDTCVSWLPAPTRAAMPLLDRIARRWLMRSQSPYVQEIKAIAVALGFPGIWFLNGSYQWSCTALAREEAGVPWLARTLDWPFPGLGRYVEVARMRGAAGEFFSVTWPGYVGVLSGLAPGRFGASINQGPLRRRTHLRLLRPLDFALNGIGTMLWQRSIPPDQLLRFVFEEAGDYVEAKRMLELTPIARPVIFTLAGCHKGERCVIERTEDDFTTRIDDFGAANDWLEPQSGWE